MAKRAVFCAVLGLALIDQPALAAISTFTASLTGAEEVPPNASPATGGGSVVLDDIAQTITVNESFSGLTAPAAVSHIHGPAPAGISAPVLFTLSGVPAATSGSIPEQTFAIAVTQIAQLQAGLFYMDIHSASFPGGEIRGQLIPVTATPTATATSTATATATGTSTNTATSTPTATDTPTPQPNGSSCTASGQCASTFCADGVCCNTACDAPEQQCNLPGQVGTCASNAAAAPAASNTGLLVMLGVLIGAAFVAMRMRRA